MTNLKAASMTKALFKQISVRSWEEGRCLPKSTMQKYL